MKIRTGDTVVVIAGKEKGKTGKVIRAFPQYEKVIVEGVNLRKVHKRAGRSGQKGQVVEQNSPVHVSNVMVLSGKKRSRVGYEVKGDKKVRVAKKGGELSS